MSSDVGRDHGTAALFRLAVDSYRRAMFARGVCAGCGQPAEPAAGHRSCGLDVGLAALLVLGEQHAGEPVGDAPSRPLVTFPIARAARLALHLLRNGLLPPDGDGFDAGFLRGWAAACQQYHDAVATTVLEGALAQRAPDARVTIEAGEGNHLLVEDGAVIARTKSTGVALRIRDALNWPFEAEAWRRYGEEVRAACLAAAEHATDHQAAVLAVSGVELPPLPAAAHDR